MHLITPELCNVVVVLFLNMWRVKMKRMTQVHVWWDIRARGGWENTCYDKKVTRTDLLCITSTTATYCETPESAAVTRTCTHVELRHLTNISIWTVLTTTRMLYDTFRWFTWNWFCQKFAHNLFVLRKNTLHFLMTTDLGLYIIKMKYCNI